LKNSNRCFTWIN